MQFCSMEIDLEDVRNWRGQCGEEYEWISAFVAAERAAEASVAAIGLVIRQRAVS